MDINLKRTKILEKILEEYKHDFEVLKAIRDGENLADYIKDLAVIHPNEYNKILDQNANTLGEMLKIFTKAQKLIEQKQEWYNIYKDYVYYFLGSCVYGSDRLTYKTSNLESIYLSQIDEEGKIDYTPYLKKLGINSIESLHPDFNGESPHPKKERIKVMGIKSNISK